MKNYVNDEFTKDFMQDVSENFNYTCSDVLTTFLLILGIAEIFFYMFFLG